MVSIRLLRSSKVLERLLPTSGKLGTHKRDWHLWRWKIGRFNLKIAMLSFRFIESDRRMTSLNLKNIEELISNFMNHYALKTCLFRIFLVAINIQYIASYRWRLQQEIRKKKKRKKLHRANILNSRSDSSNNHSHDPINQKKKK